MTFGETRGTQAAGGARVPPPALPAPRGDPRPLGRGIALALLPSIVRQGKRVPESHFAVRQRDYETVALVACHCRTASRLPVAELYECPGCARIFLFTGKALWAVRPGETA